MKAVATKKLLVAIVGTCDVYHTGDVHHTAFPSPAPQNFNHVLHYEYASDLKIADII